jgi:hypothetical protein
MGRWFRIFSFLRASGGNHCLWSCSVLSLASPCGPSGLGSTLIKTVELGCCSRIAGIDDLAASNPRDCKMFTNALAAVSFDSSPVVLTKTPLDGGRLVPIGTGPSALFIIGSGSVGFHPARALARSAANPNASISLMLYVSHALFMENPFNSSAIFACCVSVSLRQAIASSSCMRARRSDSAVCEASAAFRLAIAMSFSNIPAVCLASNAERSAFCRPHLLFSQFRFGFRKILIELAQLASLADVNDISSDEHARTGQEGEK